MTWARLAFAMCIACSTIHHATASELRLGIVPNPGPVQPGDVISVTVSMADLNGAQTAGFQAFLEFDDQALKFISGGYTSEPFGLPVITPIQANGNQIDLASGINVFAGQSATSADATLVVLSFIAQTEQCVVDSITFRPHDPPSRITDALGVPILPLSLVALPNNDACPTDHVIDGEVGVPDLLKVIESWGPCGSGDPCCEDINDDLVIGVEDLLAVIMAWGPCPEAGR